MHRYVYYTQYRSNILHCIDILLACLFYGMLFLAERAGCIMKIPKVSNIYIYLPRCIYILDIDIDILRMHAYGHAFPTGCLFCFKGIYFFCFNGI